jgi:hypothetical protein
MASLTEFPSRIRKAFALLKNSVDLQLQSIMLWNHERVKWAKGGAPWR